jgi:hypothetical protein
MSTFHHAQQGRNTVKRPARAKDRLPIRQSAVIIAGLSAISWAAFIALTVGLRSLI